jgi:hypothetical protein
LNFICFILEFFYKFLNHSPFPFGIPGANIAYNSSYITNTIEAPIPLNTFESAPLKNALGPSFLAILAKQSKVPVYNKSERPDCIINRLLTVSRG